MTSPQEALGDGAVDWERERDEWGAATFFNYRVRARLFHRLAQFSTRPEAIFWSSREVSAAFREYEETVEAAVRAQIDEDVRTLVEASAAAMSALDRAEVVSGFYEESSSIRFYCPECEAEAGWRSNGTLKAAHEAGCELAATVSSLRAALEPFKAVAPTADVEEVERGG